MHPLGAVLLTPSSRSVHPTQWSYLHTGMKPPLKSFTSHSYENCRGVGAILPILACPEPRRVHPVYPESRRELRGELSFIRLPPQSFPSSLHLYFQSLNTLLLPQPLYFQVFALLPGGGGSTNRRFADSLPLSAFPSPSFRSTYKCPICNPCIFKSLQTARGIVGLLTEGLEVRCPGSPKSSPQRRKKQTRLVQSGGEDLRNYRRLRAWRVEKNFRWKEGLGRKLLFIGGLSLSARLLNPGVAFMRVKGFGGALLTKSRSQPDEQGNS
jgi:hypothetical protein